jgi:hypothetical protein
MLKYGQRLLNKRQHLREQKATAEMRLRYDRLVVKILASDQVEAYNCW